MTEGFITMLFHLQGSPCYVKQGVDAFQTRATGTQNRQKTSHVGMDASFLATTRT